LTRVGSVGLISLDRLSVVLVLNDTKGLFDDGLSVLLIVNADRERILGLEALIH